MSTRPPASLMRDLFASTKRLSWSPACVRNAVRSRLASDAISPRALDMLAMLDRPPCPWASSSVGSCRRKLMRFGSRVVLQICAHALAQEHRMVALEHPLTCAMPDRAAALVAFELVDRAVVGQLEQDHVVVFPAVRDVVPAQ